MVDGIAPMTGQEIVLRPDQSVELSVAEIKNKVAKVREVAASVMVEGIHYGTIPGTNKPTLYKAGAEILCLTFMLAPRYEGERQPIDLGNGHREYVVRCDLFHNRSGAFYASGVGSCSTLEAKYRYRPGPVVDTGKPVPKEYWNIRNANPEKALALIGGPGHSTKKFDKEWHIVEKGEPIENANIADQYNTVLKMAAKRSYIDAVLKATAASEVYTQDMDDIADNQKAMAEAHGEPEPSSDDTPEPISEPQRKRFYALYKKAGLSDEAVNAKLKEYGYEHTNEITKANYEALCKWAESGGKAEPTSQSTGLLPDGIIPQDAIYGILELHCSGEMQAAEEMLKSLTLRFDPKTKKNVCWMGGMQHLAEMPDEAAWDVIRKLADKAKSSYEKFCKGE